MTATVASVTSGVAVVDEVVIGVADVVVVVVTPTVKALVAPVESVTEEEPKATMVGLV